MPAKKTPKVPKVRRGDTVSRAADPKFVATNIPRALVESRSAAEALTAARPVWAGEFEPERYDPHAAAIVIADAVTIGNVHFIADDGTMRMCRIHPVTDPVDSDLVILVPAGSSLAEQKMRDFVSFALSAETRSLAVQLESAMGLARRMLNLIVDWDKAPESRPQTILEFKHALREAEAIADEEDKTPPPPQMPAGLPERTEVPPVAVFVKYIDAAGSVAVARFAGISKGDHVYSPVERDPAMHPVAAGTAVKENAVVIIEGRRTALKYHSTAKGYPLYIASRD